MRGIWHNRELFRKARWTNWRSLGDLIQPANELQARGEQFESLTERLEANSPAGKLVFHVFAALAESNAT
jgi:DNA invertase Pin-like site-specific DNA recombinase